MGLGKKAKARAKIMKGKARKHAGKATGNKRLRAKGKAGEIVGKLKLKAEKAKDALSADQAYLGLAPGAAPG
jgi:uncharacterized protein YjbJ (UPF0337 family)